jgi:hypothetical protein
MLYLFASLPSRVPPSPGRSPLRTTLAALALTFAMASSGCSAHVGPLDGDATDAANTADASTSFDAAALCRRMVAPPTCSVSFEWARAFCDPPDESDPWSLDTQPEEVCARLCPTLQGPRPLRCEGLAAGGSWWLYCSRCP